MIEQTQIAPNPAVDSFIRAADIAAQKPEEWSRVIDSISEPFGRDGGCVEVSWHYESNGRADAYESKRFALSWEHYNDDGTPNTPAIVAYVNIELNDCAPEVMTFEEQEPV